MKMKNVLFVPGIKKNLLSISTLDAKGMRVSFVDGQVIMWPKGNKRIHHAHTVEDDEPSAKRIRQESDSSSDEEYVMIFALTRIVSHGSNDWLIDNGASKHMMGFKESFVKLSEHESPHKVKLGG